MEPMPKQIAGVLILLAAFLLSGCGSPERDSSVDQKDRSIRVDGTLEFYRPDHSVIQSIQIEISETPEAHAKGLMGRRVLELNEGMLFVYQSAEPQTFWMHNTPLSLDMIFVDEKGRVVNIAKRTTPMSDQTYSSKGPVQSVVEVRAGFTDHFGIDEGTRIRWRRF